MVSDQLVQSNFLKGLFPAFLYIPEQVMYKILAFSTGGAEAELLLKLLIAGAAGIYRVFNHAIGYIFAMTGFLVSVHGTPL